jgi:hypothetical protein
VEGVDVAVMLIRAPLSKAKVSNILKICVTENSVFTLRELECFTLKNKKRNKTKTIRRSNDDHMKVRKVKGVETVRSCGELHENKTQNAERRTQD